MIRKFARPCAIALAVLSLNLGAVAPTMAAEVSPIPGNVAATTMLDRNNTVILLVDHQLGLFTGIRDTPVLDVKRNVVNLVKLARTLDIPVIVTATLPDGPFGPTIPELRAALPEGSKIIVRNEINAWESKDVQAAIKATGRKQLLVAGVSTEVCAGFPALSSKAAGYDTRLVLDASGTFSDVKRTVALQRMTLAGIPITDVATTGVELLRNNADPKAHDVYGALDIPFATLLYQLDYAKAIQDAKDAKENTENAAKAKGK